MASSHKLFVAFGFIIAIAGLIPYIVDFNTGSINAILSELFYYSPFLTPALMSSIALLKGRVGPVTGSFGWILIIVALPMLWLLYSISFGDTSPEVGIAFLAYAFLNIPFLVGSIIGLLVAAFSRS